MIDALLASAQSTTKIDGGYELLLPANAATARKLLELVIKERACCRNLTFELAFAADRGPIRFRVTGMNDTLPAREAK